MKPQKNFRASRFLVLFVVFSLACASNPSRSTDQYIQKYKKEFENDRQYFHSLSSQPVMGPYARRVEGSIDDYIRLIAETFPKVQSLHIHFIMMTHYNSGLNDEVLKKVQESQPQVKALLEELHPDVVGYEGQYASDVTIDGLAEKFREMDKEYSAFLRQETEEEIQRLVAENLKIDGVLQYRRDHPEARIMGIEDKNLYYFHNLCSIYIRGAKDPETVKAVYEIFMRTQRTRDKIVIAKVVQELRRLNKKDGAIVMGAGHEQDLREISSDIGLDSIFHETFIKDPKK